MDSERLETFESSFCSFRNVMYAYISSIFSALDNKDEVPDEPSSGEVMSDKVSAGFKFSPSAIFLMTSLNYL